MGKRDSSGRTAHTRATRRWAALYYCEDCGSAFRRDRQGFLRADAVPGYLYRDGADKIAG